MTRRRFVQGQSAAGMWRDRGEGGYDAFRDARSTARCRSQSACSRIQNCGEVSSNRASRSAVSAVIARFPRTISVRRFNETLRRRAASACPPPSGFRNSSNKISPGGMAGPSQLESLVIILDADFEGMLLLPSERYAILIVDSNAVPPGLIASQTFQSIA